MTERTRAGSIATAIRPRLRAPRRRVLAIAIGLLAVWPAASSAAVNRTSDHTALTAYHAYLNDLISMVPSWRTADDAYISSISGKCAGALSSLQHAAPGSFNKRALLAFGLEAGADLDAVSVYPSARPALGTLAASLGSLHWSNPGIQKVVSGYIGAERRLFALTPSDLCADAHALAASHGRSVSRGTAAFVTKFGHRVVAAGQIATAFLTVLARFAGPSDRGLVSSTNHLLHQFGTKVTALAGPEAKKLVAVLGL